MQNLKNFLIEIAKEKDLKELYSLEEECFPLDKITFTKYKKLFKRTTIKIFSLKILDVIIGSAIIIMRKNSPIVKIYSFSIHQYYRGSNAATHLFNYLEKYFLNKAYQKIQLEVKKNNLSAIQFYKKMGFEEFGEYRAYYADGSDALRMNKQLPSQ